MSAGGQEQTALLQANRALRHEVETLRAQLQDYGGAVRAACGTGPDAAPMLNSESRAWALEEMIGELSATAEQLKRVNDQLTQATEQIHAWQAHYERLFKDAPDAFLVTDTTGRILEANRLAMAILGLEDTTSSLPEFLELEPSVFADRVRQVLADTGPEKWEARLRPGRGAAIDIAVSCVAVRNEAGRPIFILWILRDITDQKWAERRFAEEAQELARSNADLQQFASIVSHDLRSPLTSLAGCVELLEEQLAGELDPELREITQDIRGSIRHMDRLIKCLLNYSRVGKGGLKTSTCDTAGVLSGVVKGMKAVLEQTGGRVTHDPLPTIRADQTLLSQLFQNLIENAIKYRSEAPPAVHVSAHRAPNEWVFSVRDNGIGIPPRHAERVFQIFQRLHADEARYPGLGAGLAICKKIVEQHKGRIWVESQPGEGATFFFSLPISARDRI